MDRVCREVIKSLSFRERAASVGDRILGSELVLKDAVARTPLFDMLYQRANNECNSFP